MNQSTWQRGRLIILAGCNLAVLIALLLLITKSPQDKFFSNAVFDGWIAIKTDLNPGEESIPGRSDREPKNHNLTVEVYALSNSRGDTLSFLNRSKKLKLKSEDIKLESDNQIGSYGWLTRNNRTQLNACIHSGGKTAFTTEQFGKLVNGNLKSRLLPWILGLKDLRDWDCLWIDLSVSLNDITEQEAHQILKQRLLILLQEIHLN